MYKRVLAVGAHVDDVELGCVGTLLKFKEQGADVDIVVSTDQTSPRASIHGPVNYWKSQDILGIPFNIMRNGRDDNDRPIIKCDSETISRMDTVVNNGYDLVITHSAGDYHQDHRTTYDVVRSSLRSFTGEFWCMEIGQYSNKNSKFNPNIFVDITEHMEQKLSALSCYNIDDHPIRGLAAYRGQLSGVKYAEAFELQWKTY